MPTGLIRRFDDLGRIVIPKEVRKRLRIHDGDPMEIFIDGDRVVLCKYITSVINDRFFPVANILRERGYSFAIYDDADMVYSSGRFPSGLFPKQVPYSWSRERYSYREGNAVRVVLPILKEGDLYGYIVFAPDDNHNEEFVAGVIAAAVYGL